MYRLPPILKKIARTAAAAVGAAPGKGAQQGLCLLSDIKNLLPDARFGIIFDVGANQGQSAIPMAHAFANATIHCFEPSASTFDELSAASRGNTRIRIHRLALGEAPGQGQLVLTDKSTQRYLSEGDSNGIAKETVTVSTVDDFCARNKIGRIDLLKVDTEGHDLHVLRGAARKLAAREIGVVLVEAGFGPDNTTHVPFSALSQELGLHGYQIFGFYEQMHEWKLGRPNLRRANVAFLSADLCVRNETQHAHPGATPHTKHGS